MRTVITVDETRETIPFFGSTAASKAGGVHRRHRRRAQSKRGECAVEDSRRAATAVAVSPRRPRPGAGAADDPVRCRKLLLRPLATDDVIRAAARATDMAADDPALAEAANAGEGSVGRTLALLGGNALKLQQARPRCWRPCPRSIRVSSMHSGTPLASATAWRWRLSSMASSAGSASACAATATPMRTFRALHGWRRYGKRSPAPRAIPQTTISSESPLFSRCFRCSRTRHARSSIDLTTRPFPATKEFVVATRKKSSKKKRARKTVAAQRRSVSKRLPRKDEDNQGGEEGGQEDCKEAGEEGSQEARQEIGEEGQGSQSNPCNRSRRRRLLHQSQ